MNRYFWSRVISLCLIVAGLGVYQSQAKSWKVQEEQNQKQIAKVEAYNKKIEKENKKEEKAIFADGVYEGSAEGFGGEVIVSVTIKEDAITALNVVQADGEDSAYLSMAMEMLERIINAQSYEVDTVTGATYSSTGIKNAVKAALEQAKL